MNKPVIPSNQLKLNCTYDLCELIQNRYNEHTGLFDIVIEGEPHEVKVTNPSAGISLYMNTKKDWLKESILSFKGKTLYLFGTFPIPAQMQYQTSRKNCTRYKNIFVQFT